jgi:hypothetical protein
MASNSFLVEMNIMTSSTATAGRRSGQVLGALSQSVHIDSPAPDGTAAVDAVDVTVTATANNALEQIHCDLWQLGTALPALMMQQPIANPVPNMFAFKNVPSGACMIRAYLDSDHTVAHSITINFP